MIIISLFNTWEKESLGVKRVIKFTQQESDSFWTQQEILLQIIAQRMFFSTRVQPNACRDTKFCGQIHLGNIAYSIIRESHNVHY